MYKIVDPNLGYLQGCCPSDDILIQRKDKDMFILDTKDMSLELMDFDSVMRVYRSYPELCDFKYKEGKGFEVKRENFSSLTINGVQHRYTVVQNIALDVSKHGKFRLFKPVTSWFACYQYRYENLIFVRGLLRSGGQYNNYYPCDVVYSLDGRIYGWRTNVLKTLNAGNKLAFSFLTPDRFAISKNIGGVYREMTSHIDYSVV